MDIKIAILQYHIILEDIDKNISVVENYIAKASKDGVELFLLPEMSFSGFSMNTGVTARKLEDMMDKLTPISKRFNIAIGFGWVENTSDQQCICYNKYTIIDGEEAIITYSKIHPFSYSSENEYFAAGDKIVQFEFKGIPFSLFICYDLRFPEIFQIVSGKAHVILLPACWPEKRAEHWKTLLCARAIENQCYIIGINCVGDIGGLLYSGDSRIINSDGKVVACAESNKEQMIIYNLDDDVDAYRESFPVKKDRREDLYGVLRNEHNRKI